jgi:hypothetical protein
MENGMQAAYIVVSITAVLSWYIAIPFRREQGGINVPFLFAGILLAPILSIFLVFGYGMVCENLDCLPGGEANWQPLLSQMFAIPIFWILMVTSASLKKRRKK